MHLRVRYFSLQNFEIYLLYVAVELKCQILISWSKKLQLKLELSPSERTCDIICETHSTALILMFLVPLALPFLTVFLCHTPTSCAALNKTSQT